MAKKPPKTPLRLVAEPGEIADRPPRNLGDPGRSLWNRIRSEYNIDDAGGIELLLLACEATDRVAALRSEIERDGAVVRVRGSIKEHPALRAEIAAMSFVARKLARLSLDVEPLRSVGRPPRAIGRTPTI